MSVFFMDDDTYRVRQFRTWAESNRAGHVVYVALDGKEGIQLLGEMSYDYWHLDHDMGPNAYAIYHDPTIPKDPNEVDGRDVARWIVANVKPEQFPKEVIVHSFNRRKAMEMIEILATVGIKAKYQYFSEMIAGRPFEDIIEV